MVVFRRIREPWVGYRLKFAMQLCGVNITIWPISTNGGNQWQELDVSVSMEITGARLS
jgi:hypothetical protein